MFNGATGLTEFKYNNMSSLKEGKAMFYGCTNLKSITFLNLSALENGRYMFDGCSSPDFISVKTDLHNLKYATQMFGSCSNLTIFETNNLSKLSMALNMFHSCINLSKVKGDNVTVDENGETIHYVDASNVTIGKNMFYGCSSLRSLTIDISKVEQAECMFGGSTRNLSSFTPINGLSKLRVGNEMFNHCKLDSPSVVRIMNALPDLTNVQLGTYTFKDEDYSYSKPEGKLDIGISVSAIDTLSTYAGAPLVFTKVGTRGESQEFTYKGWRIVAKIENYFA